MGVSSDVLDGWPIVTKLPELGHILFAVGSVQACVDNIFDAAWRCFWSIVGFAYIRPFTVARRLNAIDSNVKPILVFQMPRWPFQVILARDRLDAAADDRNCSDFASTSTSDDRDFLSPPWP